MPWSNSRISDAVTARRRSPSPSPSPSAERQSEGNSSVVQLGVKLRHARLVAGLTLLQLSQKAGCSESLISKLEHGAANPSLTMLHRLAAALGTNIAELTSEEMPAGGPIFRSGERPVIRAGGIALERLVLPKRGGLLQANIHILDPGASSDGTIVHAGEEVGYVLEGSIELRLDDAVHMLGEGDAFTFASHVPHGYRNTGTGVARVLWVNSPATF